jgi:hypothetical protein
MKTTKRLTNTTGLKFAFIPASNTKGNRIKITQTNFNKSVFVSGNRDLEPIDFICSVLDRIEIVNKYSLLVDNTQSNYYFFIYVPVQRHFFYVYFLTYTPS